MRISILGPLEVEGDEGPVAVGGVRLRALLALLALEAGRTVTTERLIDALWPHEPPANAANALQTLVKRLRAALRPYEAVESRPGGYALAVEPDDVDALRFRRTARSGEGLELWRGPALADLTSVPLLANAAAALEQDRLAAVEARLAAGAPVELTAEVAAHPLRERLAALAMRALAAEGRQAEALELFERTRRTLADELGVDPGPELRAAHVAVVSGDVPTPEPPAPPRRRGNVRAPRTSFIGREAELDQLADLLARARVVTLVGPGGAGKTRLATELALRSAEAAWMVELAPVTDPHEVVGTVLDALGLRDDRPPYRMPADGADPVAQVAEAVAGRPALLVLDNCEHLVDAAAELAERLLTACPGLRVLATSREPLNVPGEHLAPVPPLAPPPVGADPVRAEAYPSVRLLLDRARAARPGFAIDEGNVAAVVALCRRLDGMPLAIELAAARLRTMTPRQLADRVDDRFRLLTGGSRTALPRQQTLRAVVEWSWDLLDAEERVLARRLGVFAGGATLEAVEAVEAVCGGAADVLGALADKSLVQVSPEGRSSMLETIRAYALERLAEAGEAGEYRRRHAAYLLDLAERAVPELRTAAQTAWLERMAPERDDFAAALRWAVEERDVESALRLCGALTWYWWMCGYRREATAWAAQVLDLAGDEPPPGLAGAYTSCMFGYGVSMLGTIVDDRPAMLALSHRMDRLVEVAEKEGPLHPMLKLSRVVMAAVAGREKVAAELLGGYVESDDPWLASSALMIGGLSRRTEEDLERSVAGFRRLGDRWGLTEALLGLAELRTARGAPTGDIIAEVWGMTSRWVGADEEISTLIRLAELRMRGGDLDGAGEDLARARAGVDEDTTPHTLFLLGMGEAGYACLRGEPDRGLEIYRGLFDLLAQAPPMAQLAASLRTAYGRALARTGEPDAAIEQHRLALGALGQGNPGWPLLSPVLAGFALAAQAAGDQERAAVLFGASSAVEPRDTSLDTVEGLETARAALGDEHFEECFARGAAMSKEEVYGMVGSTT
ncbi:BTAD domain-containing putative transcriptional regulator [Nonomuraea roseoviolacea subsp. carminata]